MSSPTIDRARQSQTWLDISIHSFRNLTKISAGRRLIWILLCVSSVPLHLFFNSASFTTLSYQEYNVYRVSQDFFSGASWDLDNLYLHNSDPDSIYMREMVRLQNSSSSLKRLENADCIASFSQPFISKYGLLAVVLDQASLQNGSVLNVETFESFQGNPRKNSFNWICMSQDEEPQTCNTKRQKANAPDWIQTGYRVSHCMAMEAPDNCELQFSLHILLIVLICNLIKAACIAIIAWNSEWKPLVTIGDGVASFLERPDPYTAGNCLAGRSRFRKATDWRRIVVQYDGNRRRFWFAGARPLRWIATYSMPCHDSGRNLFNRRRTQGCQDV